MIVRERQDTEQQKQVRKQRKRWRLVDVDRLNAELGYQTNHITTRKFDEDRTKAQAHRPKRLATIG
jgi:hypothetical protein